MPYAELFQNRTCHLPHSLHTHQILVTKNSRNLHLAEYLQLTIGISPSCNDSGMLLAMFRLTEANDPAVCGVPFASLYSTTSKEAEKGLANTQGAKSVIGNPSCPRKNKSKARRSCTGVEKKKTGCWECYTGKGGFIGVREYCCKPNHQCLKVLPV